MSQVLLITGASGIAEATARLAAARGDRVFVAGLDEAECRALAASLPEAGWLSCDLREETSAARLVDACVERFGRMDALFNVAGASGRKWGDGPIHECSLEGWNATVEVNATTMFLMCRAALRHWLAGEQPGAILNMATVTAVSPEPRFFATHAYAASKGAVISMTTTMAAYYAPRRIRVNAIAPGLVRTPMSQRAQTNTDIVDFMKIKQPLAAGLLEASDIAEAALFLLGPESRHITGELLTVDAGWKLS